MKIPIEDLIDVILAIGDTYRDDVRSVQKVGRHVEQIQVMPPVSQIFYSYKWRHLVAKFATNTSGATWSSNFQLMQSGATWSSNFQLMQGGATWWTNFQLIQVAPPSGQIYNLYVRCHLVANLSTNATGATCWPDFQL